MNTTNSIEMAIYSTMPESEINLDGSEEIIETRQGPIKVIIYGDKGGLPLVTFHDIGMNSDMNFINFFTFLMPSKLMKRFCVYNINAPGQEFGASKLASDFTFPTMEGLAGIVDDVVSHFGMKSFIGLGSGAGTNVLMRYATKHPSIVDALVLINPISQKAGWIEWFYQKVSDSSGLVLEDRPAEVVQAFLLFIQGQGLCEMQSINKPNNRILTMEKVDEFNN
uniref:Protein NDRG3 n=1 Tax=Meloidogyne floridensis TaxID=298350 RepID=A0A915PDL0_9BILA